jgi:tetratricopeptide (TPR) repeat protein
MDRSRTDLQPGRAPRELSLGRKLLFSAVVLVAFFAALELLLAVAGVRPILVDEDPYVGFQSTLRLFERDPDAGVYRTATNKLALFNPQTFAIDKPAGGLRVFTVGGSTTYGRPFDDGTSFTGWLREYLAAAAPDRPWEVVNAGGISYASYRVAKLMEELAGYEPDLFVIYSGNNEFLEKRTYGKLLEEPAAMTFGRMALQRLRLWGLGTRALRAVKRRSQSRYELPGEVEELLDSSAGLDYYSRDARFQRQVIEHFRLNLARMVEIARGAGAEVILVTVPVNEKDFAPFKSEYREGLSVDERARHAELLAAAEAALEAGDAELALARAAAAVALDDLHADGHFLLGAAQLAAGDETAAADSFARAIAEDVCPLRALPEMNRVIGETAERYGVGLVDFRARLKSGGESGGGSRLLGGEEFLDHVHPTVETHGLLGRALFDRMVRMDLAEAPPERLAGLDERVGREIFVRVDEEAYARAFKNLSKVLLWAGKKREAERYARQAAAVLEDDWEVYYNAGVVQLDGGRLAEARESMQQAIRASPNAAPAWDQLGAIRARQGDLEGALAAGRKAVELDPGAANAWNNLATTLLLRAEPEGALSAARRAVEIASAYAEAFNNMGTAHFDLGQLDEAMAAYDRAIELRPGFAQARVNRGLVHGEQGRYAAALEEFDAALELRPDLPEAQRGRGRALRARGRAAEGLEALRRAHRSQPGDLETVESLARALISAGRPREAADVLAGGLATATVPSAALQHLLGRILAQQRRFAEAAEAFRRATELVDAPAQAWVDYATVRLVERRPEEAADILREALRRLGDDAAVHYLLGKALLEAGSGDPGEALPHLERAMQLDPDNAMTANDLAAVYEHQGRLAEALTLYRRAARLAPELELARENAARLARRVEGG